MVGPCPLTVWMPCHILLLLKRGAVKQSIHLLVGLCPLAVWMLMQMPVGLPPLAGWRMRNPLLVGKSPLAARTPSCHPQYLAMRPRRTSEDVAT